MKRACGESRAAYRAAIILMLLAMLLSSCVMKSAFPPQNFAAEDKRLSSMISSTSDSYSLSDLYLQRARLRVMAAGPKPDYKGALKDFSAAVDIDPSRYDAQGIWDWIYALRRLIAVEDEVDRQKARNEQLSRQDLALERRNLALERQNISLRSRINQLEKEEKELRRSIEEMQAVELRMERRRQNHQ